MAEEIPLGSDGLIFNPYLVGELTPFANPALRASFIGISASHTKAHFARAVMEGVAMSLKDCMQTLYDLGVEMKRIRIIGGGATTILVSHSIPQVRAMCNKILWLHKGEQIAYGSDTKMLCDAYEEFLITRKVPRSREEIEKLAADFHVRRQREKEKEKRLL